MSTYKKSEIVDSGQWPEEFLKDLVSEVPPVTVASSAVLTWHCSTHGDYQQAVSVHLRSCSCPRCNRGIKLSQRQRASNPFSEQFLNDLTPEFRLKAAQGLLRQSDQAEFQCPTHGVYRQLVKSHLRGGSCPQCRSANYAEFLSKNHSKLTKAHTEKSQTLISTELGHIRSQREVLLQKWLEYLGVRVQHNVRVLHAEGKDYEMDLYLPDLSVGVELNGLQFHHSGFNGKPRNYHVLKSDLAFSAGIKLYHFWDYTDFDPVKSVLCSKIGLCDNVIPARKCALDTKRHTELLHRWHIDGDAPSKWQFTPLL